MPRRWAPQRRVPRRRASRPPSALRRAADLLLVVAVGLLGPLLGGAVTARAGATLDVGTGTWAAAAAPAGTDPGPGPLALPWSRGGPTAAATVDVVATGTLPIAAVRLRLDASDPADASAVAVAACRGGGWDGSSCAGTPVALGDLTATTELAVVLAPGGRVALRAEAPRAVANRTVFTLRVEVPRSAAPAGARRTG